LLGLSISERQVTVERVAKAIDNAAGDLLTCAAFVDDDPTVDTSIDYMQHRLVVLSYHFCYLGYIRPMRDVYAEDLHHISFFSPPTFLSRQLNDTDHTISIISKTPDRILPGPFQELEAELYRVLLRSHRHLVEEGLLGIRQEVRDRRAPCTGRDGRLMLDGFNEDVVNCTRWKIMFPGGVTRIDADTAQLIPDEVTFSIQRRFEAISYRWPVAAALHVVFTRPDQFYGRLHDAGKFGGFQSKVRLQASSKASAEPCKLERHFFRRDAQQLGHLCARRVGCLCGADKLDTILANVGKEVHGFHRRVGEERTLIFFNNLCCC